MKADDHQDSISSAVFRHTAKEPEWLGYWLARHQQTEDLGESELAAKLGIAMDRFVHLCLCRTPRADRFREDLKIICQRTGASELVLAQILRQEQALNHWTKAAPLEDRGWHVAASDRTEPNPDAEPDDATQAP